jgi:shikimate kinase
MKSDIILIGPIGAGKMTIGKLLAKLIIYTKDKTLEEICTEILSAIAI